MKKIFLITLLTLSMLMGLAACGSNNDEEESSNVNEDQVVTETEQDENVDLPSEDQEISASQHAQELLDSINNIEQGSAGSSLKAAVAAVNMIELSETEDGLDQVTLYIQEMTADEKDVFASNWVSVNDTVNDIFDDFENTKDLLSDAGVTEFDISAHSKEDFEIFNNAILDLFSTMEIKLA